MRDAYDHGLDVLGQGVGDFVPWLGVVGKVMGGLAGGTGATGAQSAEAQKAAIEKALAEERMRQAAAKAAADAARARMIAYGVAGVVGIGAIVFLLRRR